MGPGTLYGLLSKLEKEGLIELQGRQERRKPYALTEKGRQALRREYWRLQQLVEDGKNAEVEQL